MSIPFLSPVVGVGPRRQLAGLLLASALLVALVAPIAGSPAPAKAEGGAYTTTDLNLRAGPGLDRHIKLVMPGGSYVEILSGLTEQGFYKVAYAGELGYAHGSYLDTSGNVPYVEETYYEEPVYEEPQPVYSGGGDIVSIIYGAAATYGVDGNAMLAVAQCESGLDPNAYNASSGASGLFQFLPSTWATTPFAGASIFDPSASANAAAWMWSVGRRGEWVC